MSDIIAFFETYPEYLRDIGMLVVVMVVLCAISKLYFDFKEEREEKKLYKLYHQHLEDEKQDSKH